MPTRRSVLGAAALALAAPRAFAQPRQSYDLTPLPVADGVWMVAGATEYFTRANGGAIVNIVLIKGDTGLILIDSGPSRRYGEALALMARQLDLRGVSAVVNTHHHPDHFFGNQVFAARPILALGPTIAAAAAEGDALSDNMYRLLGDWMRGTELVPPTQAIGGGDIRIDGREVLALPLSGHTVADLAVLDRATGTLVAGDLVFHDRAPTTPSADLPLWHAALDTLDAAASARLVPGHGPLDTTRAAVAQTRAYLHWLEDTLRAAARQGLDMVEIMALPLPEDFAAMGAQPGEFHRSVAHLFPDIERQELPRAN